MTREEKMGALLLVVLALAFAGYLVWSNQPPAPAARVEPPTVRAGAVLTTLPGIERRKGLPAAAIVCRPAAGEIAGIRRGRRLAGGALYFDVKITQTCYGWIDAAHLDVAPAVLLRY